MARRRHLEAEALLPHLDRLMRAATAMCGSRLDAEDLVQETCARVLARPRRLTRGDELPYLLGALRNTFLSDLRTRSRRPATVELLPDASPSRLRDDPARAAEVGEVWVAIAALPDDQRDALVAVDVCGLSYGEAARLLDTNEKTIATRLFRGRARVAEALR